LAIDKVPTDVTYYSNKAAVLMEQKKFDEAIETIDSGIAKAKETGSGIDYVKHAKALQKKGNAYAKKQMFDEAIEQYGKALIENNDHGIKMSL
jgi:stress-induced-phosphoprotein 1